MEMVQKRRQMINLGVYNCTQNTSLIMYQLNAKWMFIFYFSSEKNRTRMWANAQPDGRPAEYRWRPLFNAAKFGWRPLL